MEKIIFNCSPEVFDVVIELVSNNIFSIKFDTLPGYDYLTSGFKMINEHNGVMQRDCSNFNTVYRIIPGETPIVEFSNDGSVFTNAPDTGSPLPEKPHKVVQTFEDILSNKIAELARICKAQITKGITIGEEHFSYEAEDQTNIKELFDTVAMTQLPIGYHADGQGCREFSAYEIINLYVQCVMNKFVNETYFNQARTYLSSLAPTNENKELVAAFWYGAALPYEYYENSERMLALYRMQIKAILPAEVTATMNLGE